MKNRRYIWKAALVLAVLCLSLFSCGDKACEHVEGEWITDSVPTYVSEGQSHTECTLCGETLRSASLPVLICTHDSSTWVVDVEATYESAGRRYCQCDICGVRLASEEIPHRLSEGEIGDRLSPLVLRVVCYDLDGVSEISRGSGFIIDGDGTFITNAHVVRGAYFVKVIDRGGTVYEVDRLYKYNDTSSDYAIGRARGYDSELRAEFAAEVGVGDTVYALGYAGGSSELGITCGEITDTARREGGKYYYANTASIDHGSSGGILADEWGRVIGITTGLARGDFIAVRYRDFALELENPLGEGKTPISCFYEIKRISLDAENIGEIFDIHVHTEESGASISYWITVKLKDEYLANRVVMSSDSITFTLSVDTVFMLDALIPELVDKVEYASDRVRLTIDGTADLSDGASGMATGALDGVSPEYYGVEIAYSIDFAEAEGWLTVYEPRKNE